MALLVVPIVLVVVFPGLVVGFVVVVVLVMMVAVVSSLLRRGEIASVAAAWLPSDGVTTELQKAKTNAQRRSLLGPGERALWWLLQRQLVSLTALRVCDAAARCHSRRPG